MKTGILNHNQISKFGIIFIKKRINAALESLILQLWKLVSAME